MGAILFMIYDNNWKERNMWSIDKRFEKFQFSSDIYVYDKNFKQCILSYLISS